MERVVIGAIAVTAGVLFGIFFVRELLVGAFERCVHLDTSQTPRDPSVKQAL